MLESDRRDYYEWNGVLNNFVLDIAAKKPRLSYFVDATRRCFLIPFTPEIEVLFTRSLTNFHEYSSRRRTSSARGYTYRIAIGRQLEPNRGGKRTEKTLILSARFVITTARRTTDSRQTGRAITFVYTAMGIQLRNVFLRLLSRSILPRLCSESNVIVEWLDRCFPL